MPACECKPVSLWQNPKKKFWGIVPASAHNYIPIFKISKYCTRAYFLLHFANPTQQACFKTQRNATKQHIYPTQNGNFVCFNNINNIFKNIVDLT